MTKLRLNLERKLIILEKVVSNDLLMYKKDMQEAFQKGFEDVFGTTESEILPEKDIDEALNMNGTVAYKASLNGEIVGGDYFFRFEKVF